MAQKKFPPLLSVHPPLLTVVCLWLSVAGLLFSSCTKNKIELTFTSMPSGTTDDLNSITMLNDTVGFACGGQRYDKGDILKTTDGGFTWTDVADAQMQKAFYDITFPDADTGFCGNYEGKIFRTTDGGATWQLYQTRYWQPIRDIFFLDGRKGFACGGNGFQSGYLLQTADGGNQWSADTTLTEYRCIRYFNDSAGVLAGYGAILHTTDDGATWQLTNAQQDFFVSMDFINDQTGLAVGYAGSILKTDDGGLSWQRQRNGNNLFQTTRLFNAVAMRNSNEGYVVGEGGCFLKTEDGGAHWLVVANAPAVDWKGIALLSDGGLLCGTGGMIYRFVE